MTNKPLLTPLAQSLPSTVPFVGPEAQERQTGTGFVARLGANESAFGPSPMAIRALNDNADDIWKYGDPEMFDLRKALSAHIGVPTENIMPGEGIDGLLGLTVRLFVAPGDTVVTSAGAYPTFNYHATGFGGLVQTVPYNGDHEDPDALIAKAKTIGAKLIYLANPDNPMGSHHSAAKINQMIDAIPTDSLLVLDEAYLELAPDGTAPEIDVDNPRVLRFRTFSKAYGLAGLRIGYVIGHTNLISAYNKVRNHFGVSRPAQIAAVASLQDRDWVPKVLHQVEAARREIGDIARLNGLHPLPSATNFVTIDCGKDGEFARRVLAGLIERGIFVRMPFVAPQDRCIRVSCAPAEELARFKSALPEALTAARGQ